MLRITGVLAGILLPIRNKGENMSRRILVIFENERTFPEALAYAREFALRIDARVSLLMLAPMSFVGRASLGPKRNAIRAIETSAGKILSDCSEGFIQQGLEVSSAFKIGDPAQELMKFLADRPPFQAVIWGSGDDLPDKDGSGQKHWIGKIAGNLECPLLTVSKRDPR
jgi:hypothetical protein